MTEFRHNGGPKIDPELLADHISNPPPYFQFYWSDFWSKCARAGMKPDEVGGFLAALTMQWTMAGRFGDQDIERMKFMTGWDIRTCKSLVRKLVARSKMKETDEGYIVSQRMQDEITKFCERKKASILREERKAQNENGAQIDTEIEPDIGTDIDPDINADVTADLSENVNKNNKPTHHKTAVRAIVALETQSNNNPPTPHGGAPPVVKKSRGGGRSTHADRIARARSLVAIYNDRAERHGWAMCQSVNDRRARRLLRRVDEIGGPQKFAEALDAVPSDDWLSGRVVPRDGRKPFKLDLDTALSTGGGLGDVLEKMLDRAASAESGVPEPHGEKSWGWWRGKEDTMRSLSVSRWRDAINQHKPNGTWPWWIMGAPPGHEECLVPDELLKEFGYVEIYKGKVRHE